MPGTRLYCLFCSWSDHSHRMPAHIIKHHIGQIHLDTSEHDHCISGYVMNGASRISFAVCLTCKKGTTSNISEGHGQRWMSMHSKKEACHAAHAAAYLDFKNVWKLATQHVELELAIEEFKAKWVASTQPKIIEPEPIPILLPVDYTPPSEPDLPEPAPELIPPPSDTTGTSGWIYCFENDCMPGIYKVGVTRRTPEKRLAEANSSSTWSSPTPFRSILTKQTAEAFSAEKAIHRRLSEMGYRVHPRREFFNAPLEVIRTLFIEIG